MTAVEEPFVEEHPIGGITREEALKVYDVGMSLAPSDEDRKLVAEIGRRVSYELDQIARAEDYPGVLAFVKESEGFVTEPHGEELAFALDNLLDRLERGDSEALENFAEWRKEQRRRKKQKKRDRVLLVEAADARADEMKAEIDARDLPRYDLSRLKRDLNDLEPAIARAWKKVQS